MKWHISPHPLSGYSLRSPNGKVIKSESSIWPYRYKTVREACDDIRTLSGDDYYCGGG